MAEDRVAEDSLRGNYVSISLEGSRKHEEDEEESKAL